MGVLKKEVLIRKIPRKLILTKKNLRKVTLTMRVLIKEVLIRKIPMGILMVVLFLRPNLKRKKVQPYFLTLIQMKTVILIKNLKSPKFNLFLFHNAAFYFYEALESHFYILTIPHKNKNYYIFV